MTRAEHVRWCKDRAMVEYDYYLLADGPAQATRAALTSMTSDLRKHDETAHLVEPFFISAVWPALTTRRPLARNEVWRLVDSVAEGV